MEHLKSTPVKKVNVSRVNQKLDLNASQILKALGTFAMPEINVESNKVREPSSNETSQASRITDSAPGYSNNNNGPKTSRGRPKKEAGKFTTKTDLDADLVNVGSGPVTRSRGRAFASKQSQQQSSEIILDPREGGDGLVSQSQAPSGSKIVINWLKK